MTIPDRTDRLGRLAPALLVALGVVLFAMHVQRFDFVNDDAFISFRYARNWVDGLGLVFNPGERVEGYTNFLWTVLIGLGLHAGLDPEWFSKLLGLVFGAATLVTLAWLSARRRGATSAYDAVAPWLLALSPAFACWCSGGLETSLFTFLITAGWALHLARWAGDGTGGLRLRVLEGVAFGLAATTRPEGVLVFGLVVLHRVAELVIGRNPEGSTAAPRGRLRSWVPELPTLLSFGAVFGPYFLWRWWYYGWLFPNTYYAKSATTYWSHGAGYLQSFASDHLLWALPGLLVLQLVVTRRFPVREWSLLVGLVAVFALHVARVGGDFMALSRFLAPLVPALCWLAAGAVQAVGGERPRVRRLVLTGALALLIVGGLGAKAQRVDQHSLEVWHDRERGIDSIGLLRLYTRNWSQVGQWLGQEFGPDTSIAVDAAGAIPYYSELETLDTLGLSDEYIAHEVAATRNRPGHSKRAPVDYILQRETDVLIFHPRLGPERMGPPPDPANWSQRGYRWRVVNIAEQGPELWFGFWQRRRSR